MHHFNLVTNIACVGKKNQTVKLEKKNGVDMTYSKLVQKS